MEKALPTSAIEPNRHSSVLEAGAVLQDRYRIIGQLGKGGMGAVYEAVDLRLDATVALKETFSVDDRLRRQFEQEARLLAQLHHSALPRVSDYFTEGDRAFLVMQFISGVDLAEIIATQPGPFPRSQVIAWADQLLDALIYLHTRDRQIVHRDIKPHNLKLSSTGQISLLDFGLAKAEATDVSTTISSASIFGYTRRYSPLEQIQNHGTTPRSDIYALGATLYHLLTGVKPPDAVARATALVNSKSDPLRPADEIHRAVGPEITAILFRAMALNPEDRYASASDFREALRQVGRKENVARESANRSIAKSVSDSTLDPTVVRKARVSAFDPFDTYSILKPGEMAWPSPKQSRRPAVIAAILGILLVGGFVTFYDSGHLIDSADSALNYVTSDNDAGGTTVISQSKSDKPRANAAGAAIASGTAVEAGRRNDTQRRRTRRVSNGESGAAGQNRRSTSIDSR
ncbi:MAG TPA: serine/threonine-protein kinase [Pyrinomonadaceae bacterium]|nr:serine/threonine-protein kinase [Pyrinomonadaceae bacterium]